MSKTLEDLGYIKLKDKDYRGEDLKGRIIFSNDKLDVGIFIQHNQVIKYGGIEIEALTIDELKAVYMFLEGDYSYE